MKTHRRRHKKSDNNPRSFFFLAEIEIFERFNYYALRGILSLYLTDMLFYDERATKIIYHSFSAAACIMPMFVTIITDSFLGRYRTILCLSLVYVAGNTALAVSAIKSLELPERAVGLVALGLIAVGASGIKPCVVAFAEDQFVLPKQQHERDAYFHLFYLAIDVGSFIALLITPMFSKRISCFDENTCYPLAFFAPAMLMIIAIVIFKGGASLYRTVHTEGHTLLSFLSCVLTAVEKKLTKRKVKKDHWLDFAIKDHGEELVRDVKGMMRLLITFLPLPIFWALFEQQATSWIFQARRLNGDLGKYFTILPEQIQIVNPAMFLIFIPLFDHVVYPFFGYFGKLRTPLQRMIVGGVLAALAFARTASLQFDIDNTGLEPPPGRFAIMTVYHIFNCSVKLRVDNCRFREWDVTAMQTVTCEAIDMNHAEIPSIGQCNPSVHFTTGDKLQPNRYLSCYSYAYRQPIWCQLEKLLKLETGNCRVRVIVNLSTLRDRVVLVNFFDDRGKLYRQLHSSDVRYSNMHPGTYGVEIRCSPRYYVTFSVGGIYVLGIVAGPANRYVLKVYEAVPPLNVHMKALIPQYALMTAAEVMVTVTGLEFVWQEAPKSMKSVVLPFWFLANGVGQIIVVAIEATHLFDNNVSTYVLYSAMMLIDVFLLVWIAICHYTYVNLDFTEEGLNTFFSSL